MTWESRRRVYRTIGEWNVHEHLLGCRGASVIEGLGQRLFLEAIPKYAINSRSRNRIYVGLSIWFSRFMIGLFTLILVVTLLIEGNHLGDTMTAIFGILPIFVIVIYSYKIWSDNKTLKGIAPMEIFENGLIVPIVIEDRIRGINAQINSADIEGLVVKRSAAYQLTDGGKIAWMDAPIEFVILLKNGKRYNSGQKLPIEVIKMIEIMRERWHLSIKDEGSGIGRLVER
jgi:hypothetical protein